MMFKVGSSIQGVDSTCGVWLRGRVKKTREGEALIQWVGYPSTEWVTADNLRAPQLRRLTKVNETVRRLQKGDSFRKSFPDGGISPLLTVQTNDPFLCQITSSIGLTVRLHIYSKLQRLKLMWVFLPPPLQPPIKERRKKLFL
ncbi:uncharacterized protein LOC117117704 [Anneissia japonica]|uniref:uncharacterized protein LOC117117704 n=1 Tax=Anneissia japonica TaxID=1529436 RepID=UPI00142555E0|nr:uncharacterized protein LOC117117704 [Anneissia japonica]